MPSMTQILNTAFHDIPSPSIAYFMMGLDALVFLDLAEYQSKLSAILNGARVFRVDPQPPFNPGVLIIGDKNATIVAVQGTQGTLQWIRFVVGAGVTQWANGRGAVFTPFYQAEQSVVPAVFLNAPVGPPCFLTGHSLGGAVAAMLAVSLEDIGYNVAQVFQFGTPNFCDATFRANYNAQTFLYNHPLDPVPRLPPDPVTLLGRDPFAARWQYGIGGVALPRWPSASLSLAVPEDGPDWAAALVMASMDVTQSPHNTYRYILSLYSMLTLEERALWGDYQDLLGSLGLLGPWPA